jgi:RNA polymerase sigma-70 factor (ECF subfamily)
VISIVQVRKPEEITAEFYEPVRRFVRRLVGETDADDLTQETFLRVFRSLDSYDDRGRMRGWIFTIAARVCLDHRRRGRTAPLAADTVPTREEIPPLQRREFERQIEEAVRALPAEQREVFRLRQHDGIRFREIAEQLGVPLGTVLARMKYAMDAIRRKVNPDAV